MNKGNGEGEKLMMKIDNENEQLKMNNEQLKNEQWTNKKWKMNNEKLLHDNLTFQLAQG